jgi:Arc/MetJ family transcription regulator
LTFAWYVARVEERARMLSPALVGIARDHAAYVQGLTRQRTLLERRIYIVVPWSSSAEEDSPASVFPLMRLPGKRRRTDATVDDQLRAETIQRLLSDRCEVIGRQLSRAGLRATRLDDLGLAQLYHVGWAPEVARTQRLRRELADYTALVVGAESRSGGQRLSSREHRGPVEEEPQALDRSRSQ